MSLIVLMDSPTERIYHSEGRGSDRLQSSGIENDAMVLVPRASVWHETYGSLMYKEIEGNFVVTTSLEVQNPAKMAFQQESLSVADLWFAKRDSNVGWLQVRKTMFLSMGNTFDDGLLYFEQNSTEQSTPSSVMATATQNAKFRIVRFEDVILTLVQPDGGLDPFS